MLHAEWEHLVMFFYRERLLLYEAILVACLLLYTFVSQRAEISECLPAKGTIPSIS